jgi:hypothetical protein
MKSPDDIFACMRLACRLTIASCAERHRIAQTHQRTDDRGLVNTTIGPSCRSCEIGDRHVALVAASGLVRKRRRPRQPGGQSWIATVHMHRQVAK